MNDANRRYTKVAKLPRPYESCKKSYPEIWKAYDRLGALAHRAGPISKKNRELIKLSMAMGAKMEGAVHSHARRAIEEGATPEEVLHVVLLGLTTLGFPSTVAALTWVGDVLNDNPVRTRRSKKS